MDHTVGYTIITLSVVCSAIPLFIKWIRWKRYLPTYYHRGIGVTYQENTVRCWLGIEEAINAVVEIGKTTQYKDYLDFWIEVIPYHGRIRNKTVQTGFIKDGQNVEAPRTEVEAESVQKVMGSITTARFLPITKIYYVIQVIQIKDGPSKARIRLGIGNGPIQDAGQSAIFHEICQHMFPSRHGEGVNYDHSKDYLQAMEDRMHNLYQNTYER